ncbi:alpha/beta hydrolase fold domain-containing protein [Algihabitans sp.]|uniref:alpha/beta hydrolase fold domain-containing protein n=1 Tax=Algihabitans sp. TaxID=2821514 RepID=UPI003BAD66F9
MEQRMDAEIRAAAQAAPASITAENWVKLSPEKLRATYATARTPSGPIDPAPVAIQIPGETGARDALLFGNLETQAILYFHGGGWIVGSPQTHAAITAALCTASGMAVLSLDYRLAPEHPAPAPLLDGCAAMDWLLSNGVERLILAGDSAGAAIALAVERGYGARYPIAGCLGFYGAFGLRDSVSLRLFASRENGLDRAGIARMYAIAQGPAATHPYEADDLALGHAPVRLLAADLDPFRDDSLCLAELAARHGRPVMLERISAVPHAFLQYLGRAAVADRAILSAGRWLRSLS